MLTVAQTEIKQAFERAAKWDDQNPDNIRAKTRFAYFFLGRDTKYDAWIEGHRKEFTRQSVEWLTAAAKGGNVEAQFLLGKCLLVGKGMRRNDAQAITLLGKASKKGHVEASALLAEAYIKGNSHNQAQAFHACLKVLSVGPKKFQAFDTQKAYERGAIWNDEILKRQTIAARMEARDAALAIAKELATKISVVAVSGEPKNVLLKFPDKTQVPVKRSALANLARRREMRGLLTDLAA